MCSTTTGAEIYVHAGIGNVRNSGKASYDLSGGCVQKFVEPIDSLDTALGRVSNGDTIILMPGHSESLVSALSLNIAGITIKGEGYGDNRGRIVYDHADGTIDFDAAGIALVGVRLVASVSAITLGIDINAHGCVLDGIIFDYDATGDDFVTAIDATSVARTKILNCEARFENIAGPTEFIKFVTAPFLTITDNVIYGNFSTAGISNPSGVSNGLFISRNSIITNANVAAGGINIAVASTGKISYNTVGSDYAATIASLITPGSCRCVDNKAANANNESGGLVPTTVST